MPRAKKAHKKVPIIKKTTVLCPSRSYYFMMELNNGLSWSPYLLFLLLLSLWVPTLNVLDLLRAMLVPLGMVLASYSDTGTL